MDLKEIKALFGKSGNRCAFPGCNYELIDENYNVMCDIAHIEAKSDGGPRANKNKSLKDRNKAENLICLCKNHHKEIDTYKDKYSVEVLQKMKSNHERKFSNKCEFNFDKIFEINKELFEYLDKMQNLNDKSKIDQMELKKKIKVNRRYNLILKDIKLNLKYFERLQVELLEYLEMLDENIVNKLKKLGYDTSKWEEQENNMFLAPFWEDLAIHMSNSLADIKIYLTQLEILYYTEYLKTNNDKKIAELLESAKKRFEKMCKYASYYD